MDTGYHVADSGEVREMKHTPGPWIARIMPYPKENDKHWIDDSYGKPICEVRQYFHGEGEANAYLIASAPELLKACKVALLAFETMLQAKDNLCDPGQITLLRGAIQKAEGREER